MKEYGCEYIIWEYVCRISLVNSPYRNILICIIVSYNSLIFCEKKNILQTNIWRIQSKHNINNHEIDFVIIILALLSFYKFTNWVNCCSIINISRDLNYAKHIHMKINVGIYLLYSYSCGQPAASNPDKPWDFWISYSTYVYYSFCGWINEKKNLNIYFSSLYLGNEVKD